MLFLSLLEKKREKKETKKKIREKKRNQNEKNKVKTPSQPCRGLSQLLISSEGSADRSTTCCVSVVAMSSSASSVSGAGASARAAKRQRMIPGINPMMAGMNPFLAQMFPGFAQANGFSNMFGQGEDLEDDTPESVVEAPVARPTPSSVVPAPAALPAVAPEDCHQKLSPDLVISRNVTYVKQTPRNRLAEVCALMVPSLDQGYTAQCSQDGLSCLLWMLTRIVPTVKMTNLGALEQITQKLLSNSCIALCWQ